MNTEFFKEKSAGILISLFVFALYSWVSWLVSGEGTWWIIDIINGTNVFYGDDAYRFYLARSAWIDPSLYNYNFVLPVALFLDGGVTTLSGGDLLISRIFHAAMGAIGVYMFWDAGRAIGVKSIYLVMGVITAALIPRFLFTTLSFYGESWAGFFLVIGFWGVARNKLPIALLGFALLPLIRPEGIFFLVFYILYLASEKRWKSAGIAVFPGAVYFLYSIFSLDSLRDYGYWREQLTSVLVKIPFNHSVWEILHTYSTWFVVPAVLAFAINRDKKVWLIALPALLWIVFLQSLVLVGQAKFEERYTYIVVPVIALLWAVSFSFFSEKAKRKRAIAFIPIFVATVSMSLSLVSAALQLTPVKVAVERHGFSWVAQRIVATDFEAIFIRHDELALKSRAKMTEVIYEIVAKDKGVDRLIIQDPFLYYLIDPGKLPDHIVVGYPATTYMVFHILMGGEIFIQHSRNKMYEFINFGEPDFGSMERRALYIDLMPMDGYPYTWTFDSLQYRLYLLSYISSGKPETSMDEIPALERGEIERAWQGWLNR